MGGTGRRGRRCSGRHGDARSAVALGGWGGEHGGTDVRRLPPWGRVPFFGRRTAGADRPGVPRRPRVTTDALHLHRPRSAPLRIGVSWKVSGVGVDHRGRHEIEPPPRTFRRANHDQRDVSAPERRSNRSGVPEAPPGRRLSHAPTARKRLSFPQVGPPASPPGHSALEHRWTAPPTEAPLPSSPPSLAPSKPSGGALAHLCLDQLTTRSALRADRSRRASGRPTGRSRPGTRPPPRPTPSKPPPGRSRRGCPEPTARRWERARSRP